MPGSKKCPVKGCNLHFANGTIGWHRHVASVSAHPYWHPEEENVEQRMAYFRSEFPAFFGIQNGNGNGHTPSPRVSIGRARLVQMLESALSELRST
jgi:hypothetical protein